MLRTTKNMKEKYEQIQNYILKLIPEKWEEIHLYASVYPKAKNNQSGELFFYYLPKGLLKKRPINVYEVPKRFNINEIQYLKIVEELYKCIKTLRQDFEDTEQELWTNLTISIANCKFKIEYNYDELPSTDKDIYVRNVIWMYKNLKVGGDNKEERKILDEYFTDSQNPKVQTYETGFYMKNENNTIGFDKDNVGAQDFIMYEKDDILNVSTNFKNKLFGNTTFSKKEKAEVKQNEQEENEQVEEKKTKNQILDN